MNSTRRDLLKIAGGAMAGVLFTPAPWRLVTDTALWSENWPGIPRPIRGEVRSRYTHCTLCAGGCAMRAKCIGEQPILLAGVAGGLCPFGVGAHHLPYSPKRVREGAVTQAKAAAAEAIAKLGPDQHVAVLDLRPGRTASWTHRRAMAALKQGFYIAPPQPAVAVNLSKAKTVLSLGTPLVDGWISPANFFAARDGFRLIHAEPVESRTAAIADEWLPIAPGDERKVIADLLPRLKENGPALVVDREMSAAVMEANVALGAWGVTVVPRAEAPVPVSWNNAAPVTALSRVPDRSLRLLLIDESAPGEFAAWHEIEPKLAPGAVVVAFSFSRDGYGRHARFCLPAPIFPETADDVAAPIDNVQPTLRVAAALVAPPSGVVNPAEFVAALAGLSGDPLRERADAIHAAGKGSVTTYADAKTVPVKDMKADDFWKALTEGGQWTGEAPTAKAQAPRVPPSVTPTASGLVAVSAEPAIVASPLMAKVYGESNLRLAANSAAMSPADAKSAGLADGSRAVLESAGRKREVLITIDPGVRPGLVLTGAPGMAGTPAKVVRA